MYKGNIVKYKNIYHEIMKSMTEAFAIHKIEPDTEVKVNELKFIDVNRSFERFFNIKEDQIVSRTANELVNQTGKNGFSGLEIYNRIEFSKQCKDQEIYCEEMNRWFLIKQMNFNNEYLAMLFIDITARKEVDIAVREDITKRKTMEKELEDKNSELSELTHKLESTQAHIIQQEKMAGIGQLAAGVAHEINNPLGFIISNCNTLKKYVDRYIKLNIAVKRLKESVKNGSVRDLKMKMEYIDQLEKKYKVNFMNEDIIELLHESIEGLERINKIVKGLRMFSRADQDDEYERFDLNFIIENTLLVAANEIKYHTKIERNLGNIPSIYGIPSQINQVLLNIILNASYAIKMSRKDRKGIIIINTYQKDNFVICEVIDNGTGIPKRIINQIFNPFFTTKPVGEGTGLGLSISYDIIKNKHNGDIEIESIEGIGTKFVLRFPCEECKSR
jgi:signal transduction histidine kinase